MWFVDDKVLNKLKASSQARNSSTSETMGRSQKFKTMKSPRGSCVLKGTTHYTRGRLDYLLLTTCIGWSRTR